MNVIIACFLLVLVGTICFLIGRRLRAVSDEKARSLLEAEGEYADLIQLAPDPIIILDNLGFLKSVNLAAEQASLYHADELVKKHLMKTSVIAASSMPKVVNEFELALSGQKRPPFELEIIRKDQTKGVYEVNTRPISRQSKIMGVQVIFRDLSERKRLEKQILQSQKMEAVGQLASGVAHDFNNLLTVINGYSELQLQVLPVDNPVRADFEEILKAGNLARVLTGQLLAFSRQQIFEVKIINLNDLLDHMKNMFRRLIRENIELVILPAFDLGSVRVDPSSIEQVLTNLVVNARDAMPQAGKLVIETQNTELDEEYACLHPEVTAGEYVLLVVSDTGVGMSEEIQKRIFEPFFTTKEKGKGTGLGLSTSYGIVKQSGGILNVYSEIGRGTSFKIYLPRVHAEPGSLFGPSKSSTMSRGTEMVLVVEDDALVRSFTSRVLREQGYQTIEAPNGEEALFLAEKYGASRKIDLLITDMVMPRIGGKELAGRLKKFWPKIRVVFTSGYTESMSIHQGTLRDGDGFLQKPFSPIALANKVREVLDK